MAVLPAALPIATSMLAMDMLKSGCDMLREISLYKQKIAEIDLQREYMLQESALMHLQIQQQAKTAKRELKALSSGFKHTLQHADGLVRSLQQQLDHNHQSINQLMHNISHCQDPQLLTTLQQMWQSLLTSQHTLAEQRSQLASQLFEAYVQFGLNLSHRVDQLRTVR